MKVSCVRCPRRADGVPDPLALKVFAFYAVPNNMPPKPSIAPNDKSRWLAAALAIATFLLFAPATQYNYVDYDDGVYVYANKDVLKGLSENSMHYAFTSTAGGSWMPLTWFSHMLDIELFGPTPDGPHTINILLHSLNAGLLLLLLQRMTKQLWMSAFVAAVFAFHPLRSESVAWVSERKDVLSTLFLMLGLLAYLRYVELPGRKRFAMVALCLLLGLMAKPMLVTFPFLLLLLDFWPLNRLGKDWPSVREKLWPRSREKFPLFAIILLVCATTYWTQHRYGAVNQDAISLTDHAVQIAGNYAFYLKKFFLPVGLNAIHPALTTSLPEAAIITLLLLTATALACWRAFLQPWFAVGWFWFLGTLVPVIGFVRIGHISVAERYSYVPSVGLAIIIAWALASLARGRLWLQRLGTALAVLIAIACAVRTRADLPRWKDSISLFTAAIQADPHPVSYNNIAVVYLDRGDYERAIEPLSKAIEMDPRYVKAYINRITAYQKTGRSEEAKADLVHMIKIEPRNAEGYSSRADVLLDLQRFDEAIRDFTLAIKLSTNAPSSYNNRAIAHFMKGDYEEAIQDSTRAIELKPDYANAYTSRANAFSRQKKPREALADYTRAISLSPRDPLAYHNRAAMNFQIKDYSAAWSDLNQCRALGGSVHPGLLQALTDASGRAQ